METPNINFHPVPIQYECKGSWLVNLGPNLNLKGYKIWLE